MINIQHIKNKMNAQKIKQSTEDKDDNNIVKYKYPPKNLQNVMYLDKVYIEKVDHRIRLFTTDYK